MDIMKERIQRMKNTLRSHPKKSIVFLIIIGFILWTTLGNGGNKVEEITVSRGTVVEEVAVTGKTVSLKDVELGFDRSGRVASVPAQVGREVRKGDTLAMLENSDFVADLNKAKANLEEEQVRLEEIRKTSSGTYSDAQVTLLAAIRDAYTDSDDAIRNNIDRFFKNPRTSNTYIEFSFRDNNTQYNFPITPELRYRINVERIALEGVLIAWEKSIRGLDTSKDLESYAREAETNLSRIKNFLNDVAFAVNVIEVADFAYETTINGYKADVASARNSISSAINALIGAREKVSSGPKLGQGNFTDVLAQEARVRQYQALVDSAGAQVAKTIISAPFDGLVVLQEAKVGEAVTAGTPLVSLIAPGEMEIEANISEVNIGKIAPEDKVEITFDAYPGRSFTGKVVYIEPAETIVDNVINYKTKISIEGDISLLKSGLTANLKILTDTRDGVLYVPRYAIFEENNEQFVTLIRNGKEEKKKISVGLLGNDGRVEVEGLAEGDVVLIGTK